MRKVAIITMTLMFVFASPALAQVPPASELPGQTDESTGDQYENDGGALPNEPVEEGLEDAGEKADGGAAMEGVGAFVEALDSERSAPESPERTDGAAGDQFEEDPSLQSIEEGLEHEGKEADDGAAVGGSGAYVEALGDDRPASASELPSESYTELPDTGGVSPGLIAGVLIVGGGLLSSLVIRRR